ncbi:hypothetical protein ASZ90_018788 [hydrocarbon metagenome]|uniref:Uncharacterized protein n=1 Tax=hydrocarbon metagenome TaxID=938273 RepID=A0A0W8E5E8_9ZZZZ
MSQEVAAIYTGILEQVVRLEKSKKELSKQILISKDNIKKLDLVYKFLGYELNKHQLFEQAAVIALSNKEKFVINHLGCLYEPFGNGELIDQIRKEIAYTKRFMQVTEKARSEKDSTSFTERRMVQEISKFVLAQCRIYMQLHI